MQCVGNPPPLQALMHHCGDVVCRSHLQHLRIQCFPPGPRVEEESVCVGSLRPSNDNCKADKKEGTSGLAHAEQPTVTDNAWPLFLAEDFGP